MINLSTVETGKRFIVSVPYASTSTTRLRRVGGIHIDNGDSKQLGFIFYHLLQLIERPTVQGIAKCPCDFGCFADSLEIFQFDPTMSLVSDVDKASTEFMVHIADNSPFSILYLLEKFVCPCFLQLFPVVLVFLVDMRSSLAQFPDFPCLRIGDNHPMSRRVQIHPKIPLRLNGRVLGDRYGDIDVVRPDLNLIDLLEVVRKLIMEGELQTRYYDAARFRIHLDPLVRDGEFDMSDLLDVPVPTVFSQDLVRNHGFEPEMLDILRRKRSMGDRKLSNLLCLV